ncbi:MAG: hypothetical protein ABIA08_00660 [bacterium]
MQKLLTKTKELAIDMFFPKRCFNCGKEGEYICRDCGLFLLETPNLKDIGGLEELVSVWEYEGIMKKIINESKKNGIFDVFNELIDKAFRVRESNLPEDVFITFVPMDKKEEKRIGFNQSKLIAKRLGEKTDRKVISLLSKKIAKKQGGLDREARIENVKDKFYMKDTDFIPEKVILVDDIWVSGATMTECGKILKENGVKKVWGFTLTRLV